jgi:phosphoribosylglycinamide formyltransferase (EC 2.1.2.2)
VADGGPVIFQETVMVADDDTPESIQQKVLKIEHELLPKAVKAFCLDQLTVDGRTVKYLKSQSNHESNF